LPDKRKKIVIKLKVVTIFLKIKIAIREVTEGTWADGGQEETATKLF